MYPLAKEIQKDISKARKATETYRTLLYSIKSFASLPRVIIEDTMTPTDIEDITQEFYTKRMNVVRAKWDIQLSSYPSRIREQIWNEARKQTKPKRFLLW